MTVGRLLQFDPSKALDSAMQLFWRKGYESTSLQDLLGEMNLSKSIFYQAFKSKKQLFHRSIENYRALLKRDLQYQLQQAGSGRAFIETLLLDVANETRGPNARRGCLLINTASEFAQTDAEIANLVSESLTQLRDIFEQAILQAQHDGEIGKAKDASKLAGYFVSNMSGLKNMVKAGADRETITEITKITLSVLD